MGRAVTKNAQGELEVEETFSFSGSNPTLDSVKLIAEDGDSVDKENPSWLGFTQSASGSDLTATLQIDAGGVETYTTYTFEISASDDAGDQKSRRVNVGVGSLATTFGFGNVMGQEDKYRRANGSKVENGGMARVVARTSMPATLDIEYTRNPSDVDNPTLGQSQSTVSQGGRHEFFFNVVTSSLYAFRLTARADFDQSVPDIDSGIFYFITGSEVTFASSSEIQPSASLVTGVSTTLLSQTLSSENYLSGIATGSPANKTVSLAFKPTGSISPRSFALEIGTPDFFSQRTTTLTSSQQV